MRLVEYYGTWCGPCKMIAKTIEEVREEYPYVEIIQKDIDKVGQQEKDKYNISMVPTFVFHKDDGCYELHKGVMSKEEIEEKIDSLM